MEQQHHGGPYHLGYCKISTWTMPLLCLLTFSNEYSVTKPQTSGMLLYTILVFIDLQQDKLLGPLRAVVLDDGQLHTGVFRHPLFPGFPCPQLTIY